MLYWTNLFVTKRDYTMKHHNIHKIPIEINYDGQIKKQLKPFVPFVGWFDFAFASVYIWADFTSLYLK